MRWLRSSLERWRLLPTSVRVGLLAGLAGVMAAVVTEAGVLPPPGSADAYWHFDYTYQVSRGHLPDAYGGEYVYFGESTPPVADGALDYAAAHPPLLYVTSAPLLGPMFDTQPVAVVTWAGRLVVMAWAVVLFAAVAHFAWLFGGRLRAPLTVLLPTLSLLMVPVTHFAGDYYNDILVTALSVLMLTHIGLVLRDHLSRRLLWRMAVIACLGLAAKATFVLVFALAVAVIAFDWWSVRSPERASVRALAGRLGILAGTPAVVIGWFYAWNMSRSGSPVRSYPKMPVEGRPRQSLEGVLTSAGYYRRFLQGWLGNLKWDVGPTTNYSLALGVLLLAGVAALVWWVRARPGRVTIGIAVVVALHIAALYLAQAWHATGYGQVNWRYFMPGVLAISLTLAVGALSLGRRVGVVAAWLLIGGSAFAGLYDRAIYIGLRHREDWWGDDSGLAVLPHIAADAGLPVWPVVAAATFSAAALAVAGASLWVAAREPRGVPAPVDEQASLPS